MNFQAAAAAAQREAARNGGGGSDVEGVGDGADGGKKKRRRTPASAISELCDADPGILRNLCGGDWPASRQIRIMEDVHDFADFITRTCGMAPVVIRFRRSLFKKMMEATGLGPGAGAGSPDFIG